MTTKPVASYFAFVISGARPQAVLVVLGSTRCSVCALRARASRGNETSHPSPSRVVHS
jgi:hypothetical protein